MVLLVRPLSRRAAVAGACLLSLVGAAVRPSLAAEGAPGAPSTVTGGGVTLHSVNVEFPDPGRMFPGDAKADAINNNCLACHSAGMVLNQPAMSKTQWTAEVNKMRTAYRAPINPKDVGAIANYLVSLRSRK